MRYDKFNNSFENNENIRVYSPAYESKYLDSGEYVLKVNAKRGRTLWEYGQRKLTTVDYFDIITQRKFPVASASYVYQQQAQVPGQQPISVSIKKFILEPPCLELGERL